MTINRTHLFQLVHGLIISSVITLFSITVFAESKVFESGEYQAAVVELYTSEGCSSCPPADKYLDRLASLSDDGATIIPLAFHVDYWNYIGWEDPFSKAEYTTRQRQIGVINQQATIYTPQFVVDGEEARGSKVLSKIANANARKAQAKIKLEWEQASSSQARAIITVDDVITEELSVLYVGIYENELSNVITVGENVGKTLLHNYVVRNWQGPLAFEPGKPLSISLSFEQEWKPENLGVAVMVKLAKTGETLQALNAQL